MKILFMADVPRDPDSGAAGTEVRTADALRRLGHQVDEVWSDSLGRWLAHGNLHYLLELPRRYRDVLLERLRSQRYDVVHVNQPHGYLAAKALALKGEGVFIHRSHGVEGHVAAVLRMWKHAQPKETRRWLRVLASRALALALDRHERLIARWADGHVVSASMCARFLEERRGVGPERIAVVPQAAPGIFLSSSAPAMSQQRSCRVLYVGQFAFFKGPHVVAQVANVLTERMAGFQMTWVCHAKDHPSAAALLTAAAREHVEFVGWCPQAELLRLYDAHGTFLFPSYFEGFGKAFLEAMARGLCVVASDVGGAHDVISHQRDGWLCPPGEAAPFVEACLRLWAAPEKSVAMAAAAAAAARRYTWDRVGAETAAFYERRLLAQGR